MCQNQTVLEAGLIADIIMWPGCTGVNKYMYTLGSQSQSMMCGQHSFHSSVPTVWKDLPSELRDSDITRECVKCRLKSRLLFTVCLLVTGASENSFYGRHIHVYELFDCLISSTIVPASTSLLATLYSS